MHEYHKISSVFKRDPANKYKTFIEGAWTHPEFELLKDALWVGTEKIDGTNIRIIWDGEKVRFGGKTKNAQIPAILLEYLTDHFTPERLTKDLKGPVTLYGEGYGGAIQSGHRYRPDQRFILFDASAELTDDYWVWLAWPNLCEIADELLIPLVPIVYEGDLRRAINLAKTGFASQRSNKMTPAEGLVLRPKFELQNRIGKRIITKVKTKDFQPVTQGL